MRVELGSGRLIPGFEDQLVGAKANDQRIVTVTFPEEYPVAYLKGREAVFEVTVGEVQVAREMKLDDGFAQSMGLEGIDQLRHLMRGQVEQELGGLTRTHMKRKLLDALAELHDFEVPPSMVEAEFAQIWQQLEQEADQEADPAAARAEMESERAEYRAIAERRVRLGLLLSEIGQRHNILISENEMNQLIMQAAQNYRPEDRQKFVDYVRNEPMAAAQLRAPLFEDKVVDFLFGKAEISERDVSRETLQAEIELTDTGHVHGPDCDHDHDHDHAKAKKKPAAKKAKASAEPAAAEAPAGKPAKKAKAAAEPAAAEPPAAKPAKKAKAAAEPAAAEAPARKPRAKKQRGLKLVAPGSSPARRSISNGPQTGRGRMMGAGVPVDQSKLRVAVLLPCYNEEAAIAQTVAAFRAALPGAAIYVYDNNSSDRTREVAAEAGAVVRDERMQGKGHVVRRMFADVEADVYVMADGDSTYDAAAAPELVRRLVEERLDMVVGARRSEVEEAYRRGHRLGNRLFTALLAGLFGRSFTDIFSGYRVFSRRFVKSFPALSRGFETETEITSTRSSSPCRSPRW